MLKDTGTGNSIYYTKQLTVQLRPLVPRRGQNLW